MADRSDRERILARRAAFISASVAVIAGCPGPAPVQTPPAEQPVATTASRRSHSPEPSPPAPSDSPATAVAPAPSTTVVPVVCLSIIMIPKIAFAPGSISPTPESHGLIDQATATLLDRPDIHLVIEGHRDSHEPDPAGRLARERAEVVVDLFVQNGVAPGRLCIADFGDTRPIAPSTTAANQSRNRRVELRILAKDESCP